MERGNACQSAVIQWNKKSLSRFPKIIYYYITDQIIKNQIYSTSGFSESVQTLYKK